MYCNICGKQLADDERYCTSCGAAVKSDSEATVFKATVVSRHDEEKPVENNSKSKNYIIIFSVAVSFAVFAIILLLILMAHSGDSSKTKMTFDDVIKFAEDAEKGKETELSDFKKFEYVASENVYKNYEFEVADINDSSLIVTTDKKTREIKEIYFFIGANYINISEGKYAVINFITENMKTSNVVTTFKAKD